MAIIKISLIFKKKTVFTVCKSFWVYLPLIVYDQADPSCYSALGVQISASRLPFEAAWDWEEAENPSLPFPSVEVKGKRMMDLWVCTQFSRLQVPLQGKGLSHVHFQTKSENAT